MAEPMGSSRDIAISTPLGDDKVVFQSMTGEERLSAPFEFRISLLSTDHKIDGNDLLGKNVTIRLSTHNEKEPRYFNGYVTSFSHLPERSGKTADL